jgi:hypothetical protein
MATRYEADLTVVSSNPDMAVRTTAIQAISVGSTVLRLKDASDLTIFSLLNHAKSSKSISVYKAPSKDDLDAILIGMAGTKKTFGFNLDFHVIYVNARIHFIHFFQTGATITDWPLRVHVRNDWLLQLKVAVPRVDFKRTWQQDGRWIGDDLWTD